MFRFTALTPMLKVANLRQTISFYVEKLDFVLDSCWPAENPTWCSLKQGDVHIMFFTDDEPPVAPAMTGQLYLNTDDVLAVYQRLKDEVEILWGPDIYHYGMHEFGARDVNGYVLQIGQPTNEAPKLCGEE